MTPIREIIRLANLPCKDMSTLISRSMDEDLDPVRRWVVKFHLCYCTACRRFRVQVTRLRELAHDASAQFHASEDSARVELSPEARERLKRALES